MATELLQPQDLACGALFQSSCVIPTTPTDCSDDSRRDAFFREVRTRRSVTSDMRRHRKTLTYLLTITLLNILPTVLASKDWHRSCPPIRPFVSILAFEPTDL